MIQVFVLETDRLSFSDLTQDEAGFILELLNEPAFVRFIGDRGVRTLEDARNYLEKGPQASYQRFGFGLWLVRLKSTQEALGICGLMKRDSLQDTDIGYAFLERHWGNGYAGEAALAVRDYARFNLNLKRLVAVVDPDNTRSIKVLEEIGLTYERLIRLSSEGMELKLFGWSDENTILT